MSRPDDRPTFAPIVPKRVDQMDDAQASALAAAKGINALEPPTPLQPQEPPQEPAEGSPETPEAASPPPTRKRSAAKVAADAVENTPTPQAQKKKVALFLEPTYKRALEGYARDNDMTLQALIVRALDQYDPLRNHGIRPKKGDVAVKDGRVRPQHR